MPTSLGLWRAHLGFATETTYASTVATPWAYIPAMSYDDYTDDQGLVLDDAMRAVPSKVLAVYSGMQQGKWGATIPYYPNQAARFWPKLLGTDTIASATAAQGSSNAWTHTFQANSSGTPSSDTIFVFFGSTTAERQFVGAQYTEAGFKFSRASGLASFKLAAISAAPSTGIAELAPTYSADPVLRGWQAVFSIAGTTRTTLLELEMNVTREAELIFAGNNSQRPSAVEVGALDCKGRMKLYASTEEPYTDYRANTQQAVEIVLADTAAGSSWVNLDILISKCVFTKVTPNLSGRFLTYDVDFQAIHNTSAGGDSGPFQVLTRVATTSSYIA